MKILIIKDKAEHRALAAEQLSWHDLTFAEDFTSALNALGAGLDKGGPAKPAEPLFDIVLSDMNLPLGDSRIGRYCPISTIELQEQIMPYGALICLVALAQKVPQVAIVSEVGNHHSEVVVASLCMANRVIDWYDNNGNNLGGKKIQIIQGKSFDGALRKLQNGLE